jgi:hypothetical protein
MIFSVSRNLRSEREVEFQHWTALAFESSVAVVE